MTFATIGAGSTHVGFVTRVIQRLLLLEQDLLTWVCNKSNTTFATIGAESTHVGFVTRVTQRLLLLEQDLLTWVL